MSRGFVTRWPVLQRHPVAAGDLDPGGAVSDEAVERWVTAACSEYLALCPALRSLGERSGLRLVRQTVSLPPGGDLGRPAAVVVTAGVPEVRPSSFTLAVRLRPLDGDHDGAVSAACVVRLEDPASGEASQLGDEVRDELIALEHSARHLS